MPDRATVAGAIAVALVVAVVLRLSGWPGWATLLAFALLSAAFVATELRVGPQDSAERDAPVVGGMIEQHDEEEAPWSR